MDKKKKRPLRADTFANLLLAVLIAVVYIGFAARNVPPVARTWLQLDWRKLVVLLAAIAAATVEEAIFRN